MTVAASPAYSGPYVPNGVQTAFPFTFSTLTAEELDVQIDGVSILSGLYTVTLNPNQLTNPGGTVTFTTAPTGSDLLILSDPDFSQEISFENSGAFLPETHTEGLDRGAIRDLALKREVDRALKVPFVADPYIGMFPTIMPDGSVSWSFGPGADAALRVDLAGASGPAFIGLGGGSDLADVIRVNAAAYGFRPGRSAAQNASALTDAVTANGGGTHPVIIDVPPATYAMDYVGVSVPNVWIDAHGSTFTEGARLATSPAATGFKLKNARFYVDMASSILTINSSKSGIHNVDMEKFGAGDGYHMQTEAVTDNVYTAIRLAGSNGIFIEGERLIFDNIHAIARTNGGDDFLVLKARNRRCGDIVIGTVFGHGFSNGLAIGSEVGTLQAASAARAGRVENVKLGLMTLRDCVSGLYVKPGAVDAGTAYDWRDGLVRGVDANIKMFDATGNKMRRAVIISPARNALVEDIKVTLMGEGRFANSAEIECWANVYLPDSTTFVGPGPGATIRDVDLDITGIDPYAGVDNGVGSAPGEPAVYGVVIEKQTSGVGTMQRIRVKAKIDGTKSAGLYVGPDLDNVVTVEQFVGRNLVVNPASTNGGWTIQSIVSAPGNNEISVANAAYRPIYLPGSGDVIGRRLTYDIKAAAGVDDTTLRQLPCDAWLRKAVGVPKDTVGASGTVYFSIELRAVNGLQYDGSAIDGNPLATATTISTGVTALTPFNFPAFPANAGAGSSYEDRFLKANTVIRAIKTNTGGGQPFFGTVDLHYVQIGPSA